MDAFYTDQDGEIHYYKLRDKHGPDTIFVSKVTEFTNSVTGKVTSKRYIRKVFDREDTTEVVNVKGELVLRCSRSGRDQIKVVVHDNDAGKIGFVLQKFRGDTGNPYKETGFSFYRGEFEELLEFLSLVRFIDLAEVGNFRQSMSDLRSKVLVDRHEKEFLDTLQNVHGEDRVRLLQSLKDQNLTKQDLDILSGRKDGLVQFKEGLSSDPLWKEAMWQSFFERNTWIFGYGLDYRFLSILQREAAVSSSGLHGDETVTADFLLGTSEFTVIVELKRPDTPLFDSKKNRSGSWSLSKDLIRAVSQILEQKASWQVRGTNPTFSANGKLISQRPYDPRSILVIGSRSQFSGTDKEQEIKRRTFELFRRDSRNIEVLTYDELYDRANFIVSRGQDE
jgi:Shedu protein SduA, C-terminal